MQKIIVKGNTIDYSDNGTCNPILFIHGAFSSGNTWRKVVPSLSEHFRCIVIEWPFGGHKTPLTNDIDLSPTGIADLMVMVLDALEINKIVLIANDTGGAYAQIFTANYSSRVACLILSNCEGFEIFPPKKFKSLSTLVNIPGYLWLMSKLFSYKPSLKWNSTFGLLSNTLTGDELYEFYVKHFSENRLIRNDFKNLASKWDPKHTLKAADKLTSYTKPVLLLWGEDDKELFPIELGKRLSFLFKNSTFVNIPNSKTYVQEDSPIEFTKQVLNFLNIKLGTKALQ